MKRGSIIVTTSNLVAEMFCLMTRRDNLIPGQLEFRQLRTQCIFRHAQVKERAEKHIATNPRKTIKVKKFHVCHQVAPRILADALPPCPPARLPGTLLI